jgi:PQQ-dependent dehydrogenase (methanol/ethanol family)
MENTMELRSIALLLTAAAALVSSPLPATEDDAAEASQPRNDKHQHRPRASDLADCCTSGDHDFPKVGGNLGNQNYSSLRQINRDRIRKLGAGWHNNIEGGLTTGTNQSTPIVLDGVIYIESALANVIAVDGKTGVTKWKYTQTGGALTRRGVAVGQGLVYTLGNANTVIALNKDTGAVVWERQHDGWGNVEKVALVYHGGKLFIGTNDGDRGAALAIDATTGDKLWHFWGSPGPGEFGNDTWEGDTWQTGGATPWIHPAVDPELGLVYFTFGNVRAGSSQNGSTRGGDNLFANSIVALDLQTGAYRWHFQSIHHDIWDMDNVMAPVLADVKIRGRERKLVVYGSKTGMYYILDRRDGSAPLGIDEIPVPQDARQKSSPTQPFPRQGTWLETCVVDQPLGTAIPGDPNRAVPNYERGCLYASHWDVPILSTPGHGGGGNWNHQSFSQRTGLMYTGFGYVASAHSLTEASNGLRPPGEYQTGGIVAVDPSRNRVAWKKRMPYSLAHGNGILTTAGDLLFIGQPDGNLLGLDARTGEELWRFQTGAAISASPITYSIDGDQYVAIYAGGTGIPYGNSAPRGDHLWAFKLGGTLPPAATPPPPVVRRPVSGAPVAGSVVSNTITLARTYNATTNTIGTNESTAVNGMAPTHLVVSAGTTVTFTNPATNANTHCATQFFEGLFNFRLAPGESATYTFSQPGEYFFNDCHSPRPTGKVQVLP